MAEEITISKGGINVTIHAIEISDNFTNKIFPITPATTKQKQDAGPKDTKLIDLLRITEEINITRGYIVGTDTLTATQVKNNLKSIFKGANSKGGTCELIYDGDTLTGFIEKLTISEVASDEPASVGEDYAKYTVQLNFIVGIEI